MKNKNRNLFAVCFSISVQAQQTFVANLSGLQEVPANNSGGKGVCKIIFFPVNNPPGNFQMHFVCNYTNLTSNWTDINIQGNAPVGQNAAILIPFHTNSGNTSGTFEMIFSTTPQIVADMRANLLYFNINTKNYSERRNSRTNSPCYPAPNDFDRDGKADLAVREAKTNKELGMSTAVPTINLTAFNLV